MGINLLNTRGVPIERQKFTWKELAGQPISKLNNDAFTRVRVILMNGIEAETVRFQHLISRFLPTDVRVELAKVRRNDHFQNIMINWLLPADQDPIETTLGYEQVAIEITAEVAQKEPDAYLAQLYRFGMLEDFDHLYRFSALYDRVFGKDPNTILQSYTDIRPGRPTIAEHRSPENDVRLHYDRAQASPISKLHAITIVSAEHQVRDFYMNIGPLFADPVARSLYAEIVSIEEQHVTHYESMQDPGETLLEKWLLHKATEVYNYHSCVEQESDPRIKAIWERLLDYELGLFNHAVEVFQRVEGRDPAEFLPETLPAPIRFENHRAFVRSVLSSEIDLRSNHAEIVPEDQEPVESLRYREQINSQGSPSQDVAAGYRWYPGTELAQRAQALASKEQTLKKGA